MNNLDALYARRDACLRLAAEYDHAGLRHEGNKARDKAAARKAHADAHADREHQLAAAHACPRPEPVGVDEADKYDLNEGGA